MTTVFVDGALSDSMKAFKYFSAEMFGSAALALFVFGSIEIYNVASVSEAAYLPGFAYAMFVLIGTYSIYTAGSYLAGYALELTPHITAAASGLYAHSVGEDRKLSPKEYTAAGQGFGRLLLGLFAQTAGNFIGISTLYGLAGGKIEHAHMRPAATDANDEVAGAALSRVFVFEWAGAVVLVTIAITCIYARRVSELEFYGRCVAAFYGVYTAIAWLSTRGSIDPIREGVYCLFAEIGNGDTTPCSLMSWWTGSAATLYGFVAMIHFVIALVVFFLVWAADALNPTYRRDKQGDGANLPGNAPFSSDSVGENVMYVPNVSSLYAPITSSVRHRR